MPHITHSNIYELAGLAGAGLLAAAIVLWLRRRPRDPDEIERERRSYLNRVGRIIEGQVSEIMEQSAPAAITVQRGMLRRKTLLIKPAHPQIQTLVFYVYRISGVRYESAQNMSGLEERACLERVVQGQPASVKYDPANPGNSILVADTWCGLW
jgi:hypothetical protein